MATGKPRRTDLPENRRAAILKAARCVFARQGYAATVVEDIATQAGIAKGTLYLYFPSKEEIFLGALADDARRLETLTRERVAAAATWQEKLSAYVGVRLEYFDAHQEFLRIFLAEFRTMMLRGGRVSPVMADCVRESETHLAQVFAAAIAKKEIRSVDPEMAARTLADLTRGLIERRLLGWSQSDGEADARFALDVMCRALSRRRA